MVVEGTPPILSSREKPALITLSHLEFFYIPKVILKLYLDGKLQVILTYYLYHKRDFSYCQTIWLLKRETIFADFENNYML